MANSGSMNTTGYQNRNLVFSWEVQSQSAAENKTAIAWKITGGGSASGYYYTQNFVLKINGSIIWNYPQSSGQVKLYNGTVVKEGTATIFHNDEGNATFSVYLEAGIYNWSANCSGSADFALPQIARASAITKAADLILGNPCGITFTPKSGSFHFKVCFTLGDWSFTTSAIRPYTTSAYTYKTYAPPVDGVAQQITGGKTGMMTATLYTYSDYDCKNQVGSADSETFQVTVPENDATRPTVTMKLKPVSDLPDTFANVYVQGRSKVDADFTGQAKLGAEMAAYAMAVGGKSYAAPYTSGYLTADGDVTVTGSGTDTRGISRGVSQVITVLPYAKPKVRLTQCQRCDADGKLSDAGECLKITASKVCASVSGLNKSVLRLRWRLSTAPETAYSDWITILDSSGGDEFDGIFRDVLFIATSSYVVQVGVIDSIGESTAISTTIPTEVVHSHETVDGLALGMYRADGGLEVAWDTHLYGDVIGRVLGLGGLPMIPSNGDANDYRTPGVYGIGSNTIAATISNLPFQEAGTITVRSGLGDGRTDGAHLYLYQDYINFLGQNRRTRWMRTGETAGEWTYGGWTTL